ncbi:MAG: hypothetical protein AB1894_14515 [Chloroflexota bacterium]
METLDPEKPPKTAANGSARFWNILTFVALLSAVCMLCVFASIYSNPYTFFNLFPPPTAIPTFATPTDDPTLVALSRPTAIPTKTPEPTDTHTPPPSWTPRPTETPFTLVTPSPTPTLTQPPGGYPYKLQDGKTFAISSSIYHPELGCKWMGVAGRVVDMSDAPVTGLIIRLGGTLPDITLPQPMLSLTGVALNYGLSGYEFKLADEPVASTGTLWVQLLDQNALPLSDKIYFNTYSTCDKNLILINFKQVR